MELTTSLKKQSLLVGDTAQVAQYLSPSIVRISARNIPEWVYKQEWDTVYICFAEQRTIYADTSEYRDLFYDINVKLTLECVRRIKSVKTIVFSTTELWNQVSGAINLQTPYCFRENYYTDSKLKMTQECQKINNVVVVYPFNFNSKYRSENFLFGKIFNSLKKGTAIEIGDTHFYRDLLHARYIARSITELEEDAILGSGRLVYVNDYIRDLYAKANLVYEEHVTEIPSSKSCSRTVFWLESSEVLYSYETLVSDSLRDLQI